MTSHRLPTHVVPDRYDIEISVDIADCRFAGRETVEIAVREAAPEIVLNAADLTIRDVVVQDDAGHRLEGAVRLDEAAERAVLRFPEPLQPGTWRLSLAFEGVLNDKLRGFYRSTYRAADGTPAAMAVTQFEATDARRAFPCWDEPAFKAVFQVTLTVEDGLTALSNTAAIRTRPLPATRQQAVTFALTIPMSTYLVAFVVGRLESSEAVTVSGIPIRVWAAPGKQRLAAFALGVAAFALPFFQAYFGEPYPGDKLDLIAIPDFAFGAMENLGAITFRETALLIDAHAATHAEQTRVAHIVAHEIAHMWYGDLVTMAWWNGLWLNEAFATFMEVLAVDAWKPAWERWDHFGVSRSAAFLTDGLQSSRPIEFDVVAPKDAEAMFDVLTYEKGGAVLRMLEQYLGPDNFRAGVRRYLAAHQFANAETTDLWKAIGEACGQPIPEMMDGWIFRQGYPLVTAETEGAGEAVRFSQRPFRYLRDDGDTKAIWHVPITYRARVNGEIVHARLLLSAEDARVRLANRPDWVVANEGGHGFYRVRYGPELLASLLAAPAETMTPIERFNLVNDAWAETLAGTLPAFAFLDLSGHFTGETNRHVWTPLLASLGFLARVVPPDLRPSLERLTRARLSTAKTWLGWSPRPDESELVRELRGEILRALGTLGNDEEVQRAARDRYAPGGEMSTLDPNVRAAILAIVAHTGGEIEYAEFLTRFKAAETPQEEQRYLRALADFRSPELIRRTLDLSLNGQVRTQDAPFLARDLLMGVHSRERAWAFVKEHWEQMERLYPSQSGLRRLCEGITGLVTPALEADVRAYFATRNVAFGGKTLLQYLERLRVAVRFREREEASLRAYLARF
jgi:puromycin-sensitive aminopeptidase